MHLTPVILATIMPGNKLLIYCNPSPSILITPKRPDIVIHNKESNAVALLELTCPLEFIHHLDLARDCKLAKENTNYFYPN